MRICLGSRAEQPLHGLLPTHSEGDQDGSRSPQPKTTGCPWPYGWNEQLLAYSGRLAQRHRIVRRHDPENTHHV